MLVFLGILLCAKQFSLYLSLESEYFVVSNRDFLFDGYYKDFVVKGKLQCMALCSRDISCSAFAYQEKRKECYLYETIPGCLYPTNDIGILHYIPDTGDNRDNVALHKPTKISTIHTGRGSCLGNDGNFTNLAHSDDIGQSWWCVDLLLTYNFKQITIYNRFGYNGRRLVGFEIRLSSTGKCDFYSLMNLTVLCYKDLSGSAEDIYNITSCNQIGIPFSSRYIFLTTVFPYLVNFRELTVSVF